MSLISNKPFTFDRVIRIAISILIIWGIIWILGYLSDILIPFAVAMILAYFFNPLVRLLQDKVRLKNRVISVFLSLILIFGAIFLLGWLIIPLILHEIAYMGQLLAQLANDSNLSQRISEYLPEDIGAYINELITKEEVHDLFNTENLGNLSNVVLQKVLPGMWNVFSGAVSIVVGILGLMIIILYLIFLLLDWDNISKNWTDLIPADYKEMIEGIWQDFKYAMQNYFRAQALIAFIVGILFAIGFSIIGLPMAIVLGLFIGLLNMIPYLQTIAIIPAAFLSLMYSLETGNNFWGMLGLVAIVFAAVQTIQDGFLVPKIMGKAMKLNAAIILLSLSVWGKLLGMLGLLIALPMTYLLYAYYKRLVLDKPAEGEIGKSLE
jgi:predicted PurR-regulated permease PerM